MASMATPIWLDQISSGSCSTQPGVGKRCPNSFCATARTAPPSAKLMARQLVVPASMARMCGMRACPGVARPGAGVGNATRGIGRGPCAPLLRVGLAVPGVGTPRGALGEGLGLGPAGGGLRSRWSGDPDPGPRGEQLIELALPDADPERNARLPVLARKHEAAALDQRDGLGLGERQAQLDLA